MARKCTRMKRGPSGLRRCASHGFPGLRFLLELGGCDGQGNARAARSA